MSRFLISFFTITVLSVSYCVLADPLTSSLDLAGQSHKESARSQKVIDAISEEKQKVVNDYLFNQRQSDITEAYNAQLQKLIKSQLQEIKDIQNQIESIEETEQAMLPMLNVMVEQLRLFVENDMPFLVEERASRLARLSGLLDRADISVAEKYRQILEAYLVEVDYGRTIEAYSGEISDSGEISEDTTKSYVNYLRMGRLALYYQSLNGQEGGVWLPNKQSWLALNASQNLVLSKAIQIAQQQRVPELLDLPVPSNTNPN